MNYKQVSREIYRKYSDKEGNDHIAGDYAIEKILRFISQYNVKRVLEIGLGIGSICDAILRYSKVNNLDLEYTGTEAHPFCLKALIDNVEDYEKISLYPELNAIPSNSVYDLIIIDGSDESLSQIKKHCSKNALVFIEGGRASQIKVIQQIFPKSIYVEVISLRKPPSYGPFHQKWTGGGSLIAVDPSLFQSISIFAEKLKTFVKRRLRRFVG